MRSQLPRAILVLASLLAVAPLARAQAAASSPAPAPAAPAPAPAVEPQDSAEAKLAIVLRSYTLLQTETDQLRAAQEKLAADKASLEAQLAVAKESIPVAEQAAALREQLRQTQDQLAALALENNQLKTRLALGASSSGSVMSTPIHPGTPEAQAAVTPSAPAAPAAPANRTHVITPGDTLSKISLHYYGTAARWTDILNANRDVLRDEKSLIVGKTLRIP